jgi:hypothetical protein
MRPVIKHKKGALTIPAVEYTGATKSVPTIQVWPSLSMDLVGENGPRQAPILSTLIVAEKLAERRPRKPLCFVGEVRLLFGGVEHLVRLSVRLLIGLSMH